MEPPRIDSGRAYTGQAIPHYYQAKMPPRARRPHVGEPEKGGWGGGKLKALPKQSDAYLEGNNGTTVCPQGKTQSLWGG